MLRQSIANSTALKRKYDSLNLRERAFMKVSAGIWGAINIIANPNHAKANVTSSGVPSTEFYRAFPLPVKTQLKLGFYTPVSQHDWNPVLTPIGAFLTITLRRDASRFLKMGTYVNGRRLPLQGRGWGFESLRAHQEH